MKFWTFLFLRNPIVTAVFVFLCVVERFKKPKWLVMPEFDENGELTRAPTWKEPSDFDTAMRRAQLENFQWVYCCTGKNEGSCIENKKWRGA